MSDEMTKPKLLGLIQSERELLEGALAELDEEHMTRPGVNGEWSAKDMLAHITAWERLMLRFLGQVQEGRAPDLLPLDIPEDDVDEINRHIFVENRDRLLDEVLTESRHSYQETLQALEALSEPDLTEPGRVEGLGCQPLWHLVAANTFWHYREHRASLEAWLAGNGWRKDRM